MLLILQPNNDDTLRRLYDRAFAKASEIHIVVAYLTEWNPGRKLNRGCSTFRLIVGKDFGITRKAACVDVLKFLSGRQHELRMATGIQGFHPKALFWKESDGKSYAVIGSSNLSRAAFETNFEANAYKEISEQEYRSAIAWIDGIANKSLRITTPSFLDNHYVEAKLTRKGKEVIKNRTNKKSGPYDGEQLLELPKVRDAQSIVARRRKSLSAFKKRRKEIIEIFRQCEDGEISNSECYERLNQNWNRELDNRFQDKGWERSGKYSNFRALSKSLGRILTADVNHQDQVVADEIDRLHKQRVATRGAFLSEMLCQLFPERYPVLNGPVREFLSNNDYPPPRGASEGERYLHIAALLRYSLTQVVDYPARNLAELDAIIWFYYDGQSE